MRSAFFSLASTALPRGLTQPLHSRGAFHLYRFPVALRAATLFTCLGAVAVTAYAQPPLIHNREVYNAASYMPAGLPNGAIAQGSIFTVFGSNIGPATPVSASAFPLGSTLAGVSLRVIQGNSSVSALPLYVSAGQINAIMPSNAPFGMASIQVMMGNSRSNLAPVRITGSAFGIFTSLGTGLGPGSLQNFISAANQPTINSATVTAQPGQAITMWGTGLGPVSFPDNVAPTAGNLPVKTEVFVGGVSAPILYNGRSPQFSGVDQIVFTIPNNAPTGCWVPTYVRTNGTTVSNFVTLAIQPTMGTCTTDVLPQVTSAYLSGSKLGESIAVRTTTRHDVGVRTPVDVSSDYNVSFAFQPNPGPFPFNPALAFPPAGSCTFYTLYGDILDSGALPGIVPTTMPLDFGPPLVLSGPNGSKTLTANFTGAMVSYLGGAITNGAFPSSLFLDPGTYKLQGFGGAAIGMFTTSFPIPTPPTWTNRNSINTVNRSQPLTLTWSGGDNGQRVAIIGFGVDLPTNSSGAFGCLAAPGATSFTIPTDILSNLPPTRANPLQSKDVIYLMTLSGSSVQNLGASGLDAGITSFYSVNGKTVVLQ